MAGYDQTPIEPVSNSGVALVTTAETTVLSISNVNTGGAEGTVMIMGSVYVAAGAGTTDIYVKVYRGATTAGPIIGTILDQTVAAGSSHVIPFDIVDNPGEVAGQEYIVTVTQIGATGNGDVHLVTASGFTN